MCGWLANLFFLSLLLVEFALLLCERILGFGHAAL